VVLSRLVSGKLVEFNVTPHARRDEVTRETVNARIDFGIRQAFSRESTVVVADGTGGDPSGWLRRAVALEDGSEVGRLQAGFNRMARGLAERERLRYAFGAFVDPKFTERVLREGTDLAGEDVEVSLLFTDVRGLPTVAG